MGHGEDREAGSKMTLPYPTPKEVKYGMINLCFYLGIIDSNPDSTPVCRYVLL